MSYIDYTNFNTEDYTDIEVFDCVPDDCKSVGDTDRTTVYNLQWINRDASVMLSDRVIAELISVLRTHQANGENIMYVDVNIKTCPTANMNNDKDEKAIIDNFIDGNGNMISSVEDLRIVLEYYNENSIEINTGIWKKQFMRKITNILLLLYPRYSPVDDASGLFSVHVVNDILDILNIPFKLREIMKPIEVVARYGIDSIVLIVE